MKALETYQSYLDQRARACMAGDFDSFAAGVALPFCLLTETASLIVETREDLRLGFEDFCRTLASQKITNLIILAEGAVHLGETLIAGRYVTHLLSHANRAVPPYRSQMVLRLVDGQWQAASIANSMTNNRWPILVPEVSPDTERG